MRKSCMFLFCASLTGFGLRHQASADQLSGGQTLRLQNQIQTRLHNDPDLKNNRIQVSVDGSIVTLKGLVDSDAEKARAAKLATVSGASVVDDQLKVGSQGPQNAITDAAITGRLKAELLAEDALRGVHVETNNGVVTLKGNVPSEAARMRALELARSTSDVTRVEDNLVVASPN